MKIKGFTRGWFIKNATGILWYSSNEIAHRVKTQAKGQNNWSRALKCGIVCFCSFNSFEATIKYVQKLVFLLLLVCKKSDKVTMKNCKKCESSKFTLFVFYHTSNSCF